MSDNAVNPKAYLESRFDRQCSSVANVLIREFVLNQLHRFFSTFCSPESCERYRLLDYGCGPVVAYCISAARLSNIEIVQAEYSSACRIALMEWMNHSPSAWNWQPLIKHVVQDIEGKNETEVLERERMLRKSIKSIVACDIRKDPPIAKGFDEPYDIVMSLLCIENGCLTHDDYKAAVKRISNLVKTGGTFLLHTTIRNREDHDQTLGFYTVGEIQYRQVALPLQFTLKTLAENKFQVIETNMLPENVCAALHSEGGSDLESSAFIIAHKV